MVYRCRKRCVCFCEPQALFVLNAWIQSTSMSSNIYFTWYAAQWQSLEVQNVSLMTVKRSLQVFQPATQHKTAEDRIPHKIVKEYWQTKFHTPKVINYSTSVVWEHRRKPHRHHRPRGQGRPEGFQNSQAQFQSSEVEECDSILIWRWNSLFCAPLSRLMSC